MLQVGRSPVLVLDKVDFFNLPNPSSRTMAVGSTRPLTEMSIGNLPGGVKSGRRVGLTNLSPSVSRMYVNVGASTSRNPKAFHGLYRDNFTFSRSRFVTWLVLWLPNLVRILHHRHVPPEENRYFLKPINN
jgi:hypothetical protein